MHLKFKKDLMMEKLSLTDPRSSTSWKIFHKLKQYANIENLSEKIGTN